MRLLTHVRSTAAHYSLTSPSLYLFLRQTFFRCDGATEDIVQKRIASFEAMKESWENRWPRSKSLALQLKDSFSDLRFSSNRVYIPFNRHVGQNLVPAAIVEKSDGVDVIDADGERMVDISGSYGVNVFGTDRYVHAAVNPFAILPRSCQCVTKTPMASHTGISSSSRLVTRRRRILGWYWVRCTLSLWIMFA